MSKNDKEIRRIFWENFAGAAERILGVPRYEKGFMTEIKRSLGLRTYSIPQRWFQGSIPNAEHLIRIYQRWGVTPNELLGVEPLKTDHAVSRSLHTLFAAMKTREKKGRVRVHR